MVHSVFKALQTAFPALRFTLQPFNCIKPLLMIVVIVNNCKTKLLRVAGNFAFALFVLLNGVDVGIAIVDNWLNIVVEHILYYCRGAWSATCMQYNLLHLVWE